MSDFDEDYGSDASSRGSGYDSSDDDHLLGGGEREATKKRTRQTAVDEKKKKDANTKEDGGKEKSVFDFSDGDDEDENEGTQTRKKRRGERTGLGDRRGAGKRGGLGGMVGCDESSSEDDDDEDKKHSSDDEKDSNQSSSAAVVPFHTMLAQLIALVNVDESVGEAYSRLTQAAQKEHDEAEKKKQEAGLSHQSVADGAASSAQSLLLLPTLLNTAKKGELFTLTKALLSLHGVPTLNKDRDELVDLYYTDGLGAKAMAAAEKEKLVNSAGTARANRDGGVSSAAAAAAAATATVNSSLNLVPSLSPAPPPLLPRAYAIKWEHNKEVLYGPFSSAQMQSWRDKGVFATKKASTRDINAKIRGLWQDANSIDTF